MYFASMSASTLTGAPMGLAFSVVLSSVWGMTAAVKPSAVTSATVSEIPSIATEPFGTSKADTVSGAATVYSVEVPAEAVGHAQRALEVHRRALREPAERGAVERLGAHVDEERPADEARDSKACPVHGYGIADGHVPAEVRRVHLQTHAAADALDARHDPLRLDKTGEHPRRLLSAPRDPT